MMYGIDMRDEQSVRYVICVQDVQNIRIVSVMSMINVSDVPRKESGF